MKKSLANNIEPIIRFGIYVIFALPLLVMPRMISPFVFPKVIFFRIIIEVLFFLYILLVFKNRRYWPRFNILVAGLTVFVTSYFLTSLTGVNFSQSFWGAFGRTGGFLTLFHFWVLFIILISILKTKEDWFKLFKFSIFVSIFAIFFGVLNQNLGLGMADGTHKSFYGTIGNSALFGGYLLFHVFLALILSCQNKIQKNWRIFYLSAAGLTVAAIFFTRSRGAILALSAGLLFFGLLLFVLWLKRRMTKKRINILLAVLLLTFFIFGSIAFLFNKSKIENALNQGTIQTRLWSWESAMEGWRENPWLGWGPENFDVIFNKYFNPSFFQTSASENLWNRAHNLILEIGSTMGIVGLVAYSFLIISAFWLLFRRFRDEPKREDKIIVGGLGIIFIVNFIHSLFIFDSFGSYLMFFSLLAFVYILTKQNADKQFLEEPKTTPKNRPVFTGFLLLVFLLFTLQLNIQPFLANLDASRALAYLRGGSFDKSLDYYQKSLSRETFERFQTRKMLASSVLSIAETHLRLDEKLKKGFNLAIEEIKKSIEEDSSNIQHTLYFGALCNLSARLGDEYCLKEAEEVLTKTVKFSPNRQQVLFQLGETRLIEKEYSEALNLFRRAFNLNSDSAESLWRLGLAEVEAGKIEKGIKKMKEALEKEYSYRKNHNKILILANYLAKQQEYEKVVALYEIAVQYSHKNRAQSYASLAAAYVAVGETEKAIKSARQAARLDSGFQQEAELFIRELKSR